MLRDRVFSLFGITTVVALVALVFLVVGVVRVAGPAEIAIEPGAPVIGKRTPVKVEVTQRGRGLSSVKIEFSQGEKVTNLAEKSYVVPSAFEFWGARWERDTISVVAGRESIPDIKSGDGVIRVTVERAGTWLRHPAPSVQEITLPVRLTPPSLQITSMQTYVAQGGCEVVVYRVGESSIHDGVRSGNWWFPGYALPGGGSTERFALFAIPYDMSEPEARLVAIDAAGNEAEMKFIDKFFPKPIKTDTIEITDRFMDKVVPEILAQSPEIQDRGSQLDNFLAINGELRKKDGQALKDLAAKSQSQFLWSKPFLMMPNGKVMSSFADRRTYTYEGREIDQQDHLGFDLAVTRQSPIPSANSGVVVLAKYFGIFGNAVVVDHGYGLMSLYGHLSSIAVKEGQNVAYGEIIGNTGETGLAGGDHLHFSILLQGLPVTPVEWWDGHWIKDRIARKLGGTFKFEP